ncbi:GDSL esterase/lipase 7-like [Silene latifolia]|uniref:GDSL esterase/lipase 7-like n=1 Tax=Silene latifolia TaxID=37657 RepID=UPI003D781271
MASPITIICLVLIILSNTVPGECGFLPLAPALYVFGDSIVDNGNNNYLITLAKANYRPYGYNFDQSRPTGRFTNGKTVADFIAEYLRLPYPPPYKSLLIKENSVKGYNYASGSCGILPKTGSLQGHCLSLDEQIILFAEMLTTILAPNLHHQLSQHLAESIFLFVVGNNDYLDTYSDSDSDSSESYDPHQFAQSLIQSLSEKLQKLYELGGRKVMVSDIGPLGCVPSVIRRSKTNGTCDENLNKRVIIFNNQLASMLKNLTFTLKGSHFVFIQSHSIIYDTILNPTNYGLSDSKSSCCETGAEVAGTATCIIGLPPCPYPNSHFFWDEVHPTEAVYSMSASRIINGSSPFFPMNLEQLLQA